MAKAKHAIPEGMQSAIPVLCTSNAAEALELFKKAFGAVELQRSVDPSSGKITHAAFHIGSSALFISDEIPGMATPFATRLWLYLPDVDATFKAAVDAGMKPLYPPTDMFWGDRHSAVTDRYGNVWELATHTEDLTEAEMAGKQKAFYAAMATGS